MTECFTLMRISIQGCENFPLACLRKSARKAINVKVTELPPNNNLEDPTLPVPASFEFKGGQLEEDVVSFEPVRFFQTELESHRTWSLDLKVCDFWEEPVGYAKIGLADLARKSSWYLLLQDPNTHNPLYAADVKHSHTSRVLTRRGENVRRPSFLVLTVELVGGCHREDLFLCATRSLASMTSMLSRRGRIRGPGAGRTRPRRSNRTRVLMMTRGTRGDVQPFVALARGLILNHHCEVTICTELTWKAFIKSNRTGLPEGTLLFRPSGGDTMAQTRTALSQLITWEGQHYDLLQSVIFSAQEKNFFPSEGCCYHWALEEQPDFIVFGFTVTHLAMIVGEALGIPIVGFICQPDHKIEERRDVTTHLDMLLGPTRQAMNSEGFNAALMSVAQQMSMHGLSLNRLRKTRGLEPAPGISDSMLHFEELQKQNVPMIVPISPIALGDYFSKLPQYSFTDFIYLRTSADTLDNEVDSFVQQAIRQGRRIVLITFSSMPVGERTILDMAIEACSAQQLVFPSKRGGPPLGLAVIAMVGGQDHDPAGPEANEAAEALQKEGRLLVRKSGASFAALFPLLDAVIGQGGLGVTSEALRAGLPVITSGILLLDQRWWAARVSELGCGSKPIKVDRLLKWDHDQNSTRLANLLRQALGPHEWALRAKEVAKQMAESAGDDRDGIRRNAQEVFTRGTDNAVVLEDCYTEDRDCCSCLALQAKCCFRCLERCLRCIFLMNLPTLLYVLLLLLRECIFCGPCRRRCRPSKPKKPLPAEASSEESSGSDLEASDSA
ncbi:unnamed protein product [Effrenium voratum]|nr:unnamed protein product [Effrenium voratum]